MAYDRDHGYFHLTPDGWLRKDDEPFPAERVETWEYDMTQASGWSKENISLTCVWVSDATARSERNDLRKRFGFPFSRDRRRMVHISDPL